MKKFIWIISLCILCRAGFSQDITAAEFFVDTDPGVGNGTAISVTSGPLANFSAVIPTASLTNGFHIVGMRSRNTAGEWSIYETRSFYISSATDDMPHIVAAEYFLDIDPGVGNGVSVPVTSGATVPFTTVIPTTSLSEGFHYLGVRARDVNGNWSMYETRGFYISSSTSNVTNITAAEFFVDTDPGVGNGVPVSITPGATSNFTFIVPTISLTNGFHFAAVRTRDAEGKWGLYETRGFYISSSTNNVSNISAAEFFVDSDPGPGNGTAITVVPGATSVFIANIPTASLSPGFHFAAIRTKDSDGNWGLFETRGFYITLQSTNVGNMVAAEYFLDADPGVGNGSPITIPTSATINQNFICQVPIGTPNGLHVLAIRVRDENGVWGLFEFDTITVNGIALPLRLLSFDAIRNMQTVSLKWKTTEEVNTSYFDVERSSNGVDFHRIGRVSARNIAGVNEYSLDDLQPVKGVNMYRLKQVDLDGRFEYSKIIRVLFNNDFNIVVYPNPASDKIRINIDKPGSKWQSTIYDVQGRLVKQELSVISGTVIELDIQSLARGTYSLMINNGIDIYRATFVKQ